jgi:hypothetical protein
MRDAWTSSTPPLRRRTRCCPAGRGQTPLAQLAKVSARFLEDSGNGLGTDTGYQSKRHHLIRQEFVSPGGAAFRSVPRRAARHPPFGLSHPPVHSATSSLRRLCFCIAAACPARQSEDHRSARASGCAPPCRHARQEHLSSTGIPSRRKAGQELLPARLWRWRWRWIGPVWDESLRNPIKRLLDETAHARQAEQ